MSRDIALEQTTYMLFTTRSFSTGAPTQLAGTPVVSAYENDSLTQITAGVTLGVDHDGVTGLNLLTIAATAANGFESGKDYGLVITTGTVGGVSVVGEVVGEFSIGRIADAVWDEVLTGANHNIASSAGRRLRTLQTGGNYEGGMVWIDTVAGTAGTVTDENGVVTNPVDTLADARTLAAAVPLKALHIANGSTITLASTTDNFVIEGHEWILSLGAQDISGTAFIGAHAITGVSSGTTDVEFEDCIFGDGVSGATLPPGTYIRCGFNTGSGFPLVGSVAGKYVFVDCYSHVAVGGASTPFFEFTGASAVMFRRYSGGANITLDASTAALTYECVGGGNLTVALAGADIQARGIIRDITLTGMTAASLVEFVGTIGNLTIGGADGTVTLAGIVGVVTDNRSGSPTLNTPAITAIKATTDSLNLGIIYGSAVTGTLSTTQATTDLTGYGNGELVGRVIIFTGGTANGQASDITAYASASGLVTFTAITTAPANADPFKIV